MSRATPIERQNAGVYPRRKPFAIAVVSVLAVLLFAYIVLASLFPPVVKVNPENGSRDITLDGRLTVSTSWMRGSITSVTVKEISLDPLGNPTSTRLVEGKMAGDTFVPDDGNPLLKYDAKYEVSITAQLTDLTLTGPHGRDVTENVSFQTIITPAPIFLKDSQIVPLGEPIIVEFNTPIKSFTFNLSPELPSKSRIDEENPTRAFITFEGYEQGQKYQLTINSAEAENGATLQHPYLQTISTTDPLKVVFIPGDGESGVSAGERPSMTFSEKIRNPDVLESLVSLEPTTLGAWEWDADGRTVEFIPLQSWTQGAKTTIRLKGGPEGLRTETGSYLREDVESSFTIKPSKYIDVDLTAQRVMLYDNDQLVKTMICSSGSLATPSLTGTYAVYAKAEKVDMRGEGYFAPNVPWVLMFNGDYTIHGNYWATSFGAPTSHGCVGLPLTDAEYLFNWTPIGTIVSIHY
ncbi:MAG: L,D-transpeptidase family protein [Thermoleophilia bacterium]